MSLIECECQVENDVPVDSMGDFICPKFSVRDMIKMYEEGKKTPNSSREKSLTPSLEEMHIDFCPSDSVLKSQEAEEHEIVVEKFEKPPLRNSGNRKVKDDKRYRSKTRIMPTRHGIRIVTDVFVKPR